MGGTLGLGTFNFACYIARLGLFLGFRILNFINFWEFGEKVAIFFFFFFFFF